MSTAIQPRDNVFPGYQLIERIGSGGYAEVWRAHAPGGLEKAVKLVYGCYDEHLASQEMKAMERIKDVRHPFLLSLERFEVIDGRLLILTELADLSLEQRAQQCRTQGLSGIPRDELLRYMTDAADALDYLAEKHGLQHLDIKPANLLISGDHVKVADFGLVKELASRTQNSMVAGMTPTYSSPEMFDDAPSAQSDQYSLAIVYQEMLTGVLPFPGRTAAQLANQHLRSQPQLTALPEIDRPVVARALGKIPSERFPSCRTFIKALIEAAMPAPVSPPASGAAARPEAPRGETSGPKATMSRAASGTLADAFVRSGKAAHSTEARPQALMDTKVEVQPVPKARPREEIVDVCTPETDSTIDAPPTLYIGVGGIGIRTLCRLRDTLSRCASDSPPPSAVEMIAIDTDRAELKNACSTNWSAPLPSTDALLVPLKLPQEYRDQGRCDLEWLSHRWLYNIPRSLETRGYRALGRLALVDHVDKALSLIDQKLASLVTACRGDNDQHEAREVRIVLIVGMGGATGGGMVIDLANGARSRAQAIGLKARVHGTLICTCLGNTSASPLSVANSYALLAELQFVSAYGNQGVQGRSTQLARFESPQRPFDLVYCLKAKRRAGDSVEDGLSLIAGQICLASTASVLPIVESCQQKPTPKELVTKEPLTLRTFGSASIADSIEECIDTLPEEAAITARIDPQSAARKALDEADVDLLQCGYDRRTLILAPPDSQPSDVIAALASARPTAAVVSANVEQPVVFWEGSGISPSSLARGFEHVYPGIAQAARRLATRIDMDLSASPL
jgi:serine/threonine protein kinase